MDYSEPTWNNQLHHARQLKSYELRRHASVSLDNRHRCEDCFCCAALTVLEERHRELRIAKKSDLLSLTKSDTTLEKRILDAMDGN